MGRSYYGTSGSPVWLYNDTTGERYVRGVETHFQDGGGHNTGAPGAFTLLSQVSLMKLPCGVEGHICALDSSSEVHGASRTHSTRLCMQSGRKDPGCPAFRPGQVCMPACQCGTVCVCSFPATVPVLHGMMLCLAAGRF